MAELPERMYRRGRPVDDVFAPDELLYQRCLKKDVLGDRLLPAAIGYRRPSMNRSKYSEPDDALLPDYAGSGIVQLLVSDIPSGLTSEGGPVYRFFPKHVPLEENYAHSEIWCERDTHLLERPELPANVKKKYRQIMSDRIIILKPPEK